MKHHSITRRNVVIAVFTYCLNGKGRPEVILLTLSGYTCDQKASLTFSAQHRNFLSEEWKVVPFGFGEGDSFEDLFVGERKPLQLVCIVILDEMTIHKRFLAFRFLVLNSASAPSMYQDYGIAPHFLMKSIGFFTRAHFFYIRFRLETGCLNPNRKNREMSPRWAVVENHFHHLFLLPGSSVSCQWSHQQPGSTSRRRRDFQSTIPCWYAWVSQLEQDFLSTRGPRFKP